MARCASSALLAAVEIYNKPTVEYREQTLALLITNAWEILLKARLVQQSHGRIQTLYRKDPRDPSSRRYSRDPGTKDYETIGLTEVLNTVALPIQVRNNILGVRVIRNRVAHLGVLTTETRQNILEFGTASVQNFMKLSSTWFGELVEAPYLLPLGFVGHIGTLTKTFPKGQRNLLNYLTELSKHAGESDSEYSVTMHVDISLNRGIGGGGNIGIGNDPRLPSVRITDDEILQRFPATYQKIVDCCKERYPDFKRNSKFNLIMKQVGQDPRCAFARRLDPTREGGSEKKFYNLDETLKKLDDEYKKAS